MHPAQVGDEVVVRYRGQDRKAVIVHKDPPDIRSRPPWPFPDVAILVFPEAIGVALSLDGSFPLKNDALTGFGFPIDSDAGGDELAMVFRGRAFVDEYIDDSSPRRFRLVLGGARISPGMSGAPIMRDGVGGVIGMVTDTIHGGLEAGGHATHTSDLVNGIEAVRHINVENPPIEPATERLTERLDVKPAETAIPIEGIGDLRSGRRRSSFTGFGVQMPRHARRAATSVDPQAADHRITILCDQSFGLRRRARPAEALGFAKIARDDPGWDVVNHVLKARVLRELATGTLQSNGDPAAAVAFAADARALDPRAAPQIILDAEIASIDGGPEAALATLPARSVAEVEIARAAYLIQLQRFPDAVQLLSSLPEDDRNSGRCRRLVALAHIGLRDRDAALREADAAYDPGARDVHVSFVVSYAYVLASEPIRTWPPFPWSWPQPVPRDGAPDDDHTRERLRRAAGIFERIISDSEAVGDERDNLVTWRFAAIALDESRRDEATVEARRLIDSETPNYRILPWVWSLELDVDTDAAIAAIRKRIESGVASEEEIFVVAADALRRDAGAEAEEILLSAEKMFTDTIGWPKWLLYLIQALLAQGRIDEAVTRSIALPEEEKRTADLLIAESRDAGEQSLTDLVKRYEETGDALILLVAAEVAHRQQDWDFLAAHGPRLVDAFGTIAAVRYAAYGAFNTGSYADALETIAAYVQRKEKLPADLMRLRALALDRSGDVSAHQAYADLFDAEPSPRNIIAFGNYAMRRGDYAQTLVLAQELLRFEDVPPESDLQFAMWVRLENADLARELWRRAMKSGAPADEFVLPAYTLALQLGLGSESTPLHAAMQRLGEAGEHGIQLVPQNEIVERLRNAAARSADLFGLYQSGEIPIHLLCSETNADLIRTHVEAPRANAGAGPMDGWDPVYVRHGARLDDDLAPISGRAPFLDATSYLLAADLNVIPILRAAFGGIYISDTLPGLLGVERADAAPMQPHRITAVQHIMRLVDDERIKVVSSEAYTAAQALGGAVCDWATDRPFPADPLTVSPRRLVEALHRDGKISRSTMDRAIESLGYLTEDRGDDPKPGQPIVLVFNVVVTLQEAGVLDALERSHPVYIEDRYRTQMKGELRDNDRRTALVSWLSSQIEDLRRGIDAEWFHRVSALRDAEPPARSVELLELMPILSGTPDAPTFLVVDDRYLNSLRRREPDIPVYSLYDVFRYLRLSKAIDDEKFFSLLSSMRARALMFLPITSEEILRHVRASSVRGDRLVPTEELRILVRYIAFALLDKKGMNSLVKSQEGPGATQIAYLMALAAAVRESIRQLLADESDLSEALASWVHDYLSPEALPGFGIGGYLKDDASSATTIDFGGASHLGDWVML